VNAEITDVISIEEGPTGYYHDGYADSIAVTPDRVYCRTAWGVDSYGHGLVLDVPHRKRWDIQSRPGYTKTGDGFQVVTCIGASPDGHRVVCGWKTNTHGTLILNAFSTSAGKTGQDGQIIGEFAPARANGGVTVVKVGGRYVAYALADAVLADADVTSVFPGVVHPAMTPVSRGSFGLTPLGSRVAYIEGGLAGNVVLADERGTMTVMSGAVCLASEGEQLLVGVSFGMMRLNGAVQALPATPRAVTLLHGDAYAWVTIGPGGPQRLYREGECLLELPRDTWPVVCSKGFGSQLYIGTTKNLMVVRVS